MMRVLLAVLLLAPLAAAYPESQASAVRVAEGGPDDVEAVWHEPAVVQPGTQWQGYIRFRPNHTIEQVKVQICDVGRVCFAPPIPIERLGGNSSEHSGMEHDATMEATGLEDGRTWTFNTTDYRDTLSGRPIEYRAGWRLGMQFILSERLANGTVVDTKFPNGSQNPDDLEFHYFAFDMPKASGRDAPGPGLPGLAAMLALAAVAAGGSRRRRRGGAGGAVEHKR